MNNIIENYPLCDFISKRFLRYCRKKKYHKRNKDGQLKRSRIPKLSAKGFGHTKVAN
jgi:hypothetical protein